MRTKAFILFSFIFLLSSIISPTILLGNSSNESHLILPPAIMSSVNTTIRIESAPTDNFAQPILLIDGTKREIKMDDEGFYCQYTFRETTEIQLIHQNRVEKKNITPIPLWLSILPPLIAILMALITKEVFSSLFIGLLIGTSVIYKYSGIGLFVAVFKGAFAIIDTYLMQALLSHEHLSIIIFSMLIGGMVTLISLNGGMKGVVNILSKYANNRRSGQMITYLMGLLIFFDDYANTLVVGNTMRPVTDKLKISREKLAYLVDSTSAPIAAIAFITTWIGAELSYIQQGIIEIGLEMSAYSVFLQSLQYSFYPLLTLFFVPLLIWQKRDFGPMLKAEKQAIQSNPEDIKKSGRSPQIMKELEVSEDVKPRWYNAGIPVLIVVIGTMTGLIYTGWNVNVWGNASLSFTTKLSQTIGDADVFNALIWSSLAGVFAALLLTTSQGILNLKESIEGLINGFKTMFHAILILSLAWSLAILTDHLHTAEFITSILTAINISPEFIPALTFVFAAAIAFSTGSSWGTMAIIYPLILPAIWKIGLEAGMDTEAILPLFYNAVSCVLAGSVLGDHCSPISDTTILSSLACSCNHIHHVRTQMPYALLVGSIALLAGTLPSAFGVPVIFSYILAGAILFVFIRIKGKVV
ncbi:Na+/H+ antiporter NhaC family protein [Carboxylicivirga sp. M1479]|uniref:Na+/H+ antiporter NhaC family protein n=1 Tax=Carboxylicivirga sp. M1479 TaxID=2594476 RepID=UPI00117769C1|nr:Na+/H+ antiporter NhaC family protein [Carboxylicivirga sp. M1479]TRX70882.1 Na+/H+ antiporter NhaC family protein [Carboxylicivirga sp. M1479]